MARRLNQPENRTRERVVSPTVRGDDRERSPAAGLSPRRRWIISAIVAFHLSAVFIGAWIGSPPTSPLADTIARPFRAYIAAADLNHGYRFFAPNPGPSHLFRYRLTFEDGSKRDGFFPNRNEHWPRLLYHRYFMLAENLNVLVPNGPPEQRAAAAETALQRFHALAGSYAAQLLRASGAARIDWEFVRHYQPAPADVLAGRSLTDEALYETVERGSRESVAQQQEQGP